MATRTISLGGGNWSANTTWVEGAAPTVADDVVATAVSGALTVDGVAATPSACRSMDLTGYASTLNGVASAVLNVYGGPGGLPLKLVAGMTYTPGTMTVCCRPTTTDSVLVTSAGKSFTTFQVGTSTQTGTVTLQDAHTVTGTATLSGSTFNTNSQACNWGGFSSSNTNPRTLTLGASNVVIGALGWTTTTTTGMTFNAGTSFIDNTAGASFQGGGLAFYDVSHRSIGSNTLGGSNSYHNLTLSNDASKSRTISVAAGTAHTISGIFLISGNAVLNRVMLQSSSLGSVATFQVNGSHGAHANVDFLDIAVTGTAGALTGTSLGDVGGNSGITFTPSISQTYPTNVTSTWSTAAWATRVPLPQDDVTFNGIAFSGSPTITMDMPRMCRDLNFVGSSGAVTFTPNVTVEQQGSLTLASNVTLGGSNAWRMNSRDANRTITSAGRSRAGLLDIRALGRTITITDSWNQTTGSSSSVTRGGLVLADGGTYTFTGLATTGGATLNLGNGTTVNCFSGSAPWSIVAGTLTAGTSTLNIATTTAGAGSVFTFAGGGASYNVVNIGRANLGFAVTVTGANTYAALTIPPGVAVTWPSGTTQTFGAGGLSATGSPNGYLYLPGVAANTASAPDSAALSITGDIDIRCRVAMDSWTPAAQSVVVGKYNAVGNQRSYAFMIETTGKLGLNASGDGATLGVANGLDSSVATGFAAGTTNWIRVTRSGTSVKFYTAPDNASMPTSWTQLGTTQTASSSGSIFDSTAALVLGSFDGASGLTAAKFYRVQLRNNILDDGTGIQFDADLTAKAFGANSFTESSANVATVTITGNQAQAGDGRIKCVSSTPGTRYTLATTTSNVSYADFTDATRGGGAVIYDTTGGINSGNNFGVVFTLASNQRLTLAGVS